MNETGNQLRRSDSDPQMTATDETPWIGIHVLTEFVYCERAGVVTFEEERDDPGQDLDRAPRLDFLPDFDERLIEEGLQETWNRIRRALTYASPAALVVFIIYVLGDKRLGVILGSGLGGGFLYWLWKQLCIVVVLQRRLRAATEAVPVEPNATLNEIQQVNWWSLLKAGFSSLEYEEAHVDTDWKVAGKPRRMLQKGEWLIPVFCKWQGSTTLYPQHYVRMAAYCHLLEVCEGAQSPYAIILFEGGYDGVTVPNSALNQHQFKDALVRARRYFKLVQEENLIPGPPDNRNKCSDCPVGRPHEYREGESETVLRGLRVPPVLTRGVDRRLYHSRCGDRFGWVPPHNRAQEKGLC